MAPRNRVLELLKAGAALNGIDFVEVREAEPTRLYVHFFNAVAVAQPGLVVTITGGDLKPEVPVEPVQAGDWGVDLEGRPVLMLRVPGRGDFSTYTLRIEGSEALDPYFRSVGFSFYVFCPSAVDCCEPAPSCPEPDDPLPPIDYLAKDFDSFVVALSDFSSLRYPEWRERAEADFGVMMMEALSSVGDELSYIQDAGHLQANIETATERRAVVRLARLVDYEPRPVMSARALLRLVVTGSTVSAGARVSAHAPDGSEVPFEIGTGLRDTTPYQVSPKWNSGIKPYWWDDADRCLGPGTTSMYVEGHGFGFFPGQLLLVDTDGATTADPPVRRLVTLAAAGAESSDPLFNADITLIRWRPEDALREHHDLTRTRLAGNLVPATQGIRRTEHFAVHQPPAADPAMPLAVARLGPNSRADSPLWHYLYSLKHHPLAYLPDSLGRAVPEVAVARVGPQPRAWRWVRTMLDAGRAEECFTVDPARYRDVLPLPGGAFAEYDGSDGSAVRFGDGVFGELPNDGDVFEVSYRESRGLAGVVPADSITSVDPAWASTISAASNPFPSEGGADAETDEQVRRRAPQAFQSIFYRAVRPEDYDAAAARLGWVQRAGTVFRWTGSWPTVFTTADPRSAGEITRDEHVELIGLLNRYRLAGYEAYAPRPRYVSLDLRIILCARPDAFRGDVLAGVERALRPVRHPDGTAGFFHFDNFTLGTPFERSRLEAAIQDVHGVAGVLSIQYRRRGSLSGFTEMPPALPFATGEIFRLDNDANHPERGSYRVEVKGGK